jgi:hypothetical protein
MFGHLISRRLMGLPSVSFNGAHYGWTNEGHIVENGSGAPATTVWHLIDPSGFFTSMEVWIGFVVGIALILGAIQLRMRRSEI